MSTRVTGPRGSLLWGPIERAGAPSTRRRTQWARYTPTGDRITGHLIPPGSTVILSPWVTHRRADLWPDPTRFNPDRFESTAAANRHRYAYFPFAAGVRGCIGEHVALTEAVVATAVLLNAYTLHTPPGRVPVTTGITLHPTGPVPCRVMARNTIASATDPKE